MTGWLTESERHVLEAVCDALAPSVSPRDGDPDPDGFYARRAADLRVAELAEDTLSYRSAEEKAEFKQLLHLLGGRLGGLLTGGRARGLLAMSPVERELALKRMSTSRLGQLRQGFQALKRVTAFHFYTTVADGRSNPNWPALGYDPPPPPARRERPLRLLSPDRDLELTADVVVVGSGSGGGLAAAQLAAAGKEVLVLEQGGYYDRGDYSGLEAEMAPALYLARGALATRDLGVVVLAGSCLGGGTVVNWTSSLRTPPQILEEWEREHGLEGATGEQFRRGFEFVEERLGVNLASSTHNRNNALLDAGCEALGYRRHTIPRNAAGCEQRCGACGFGCQYGCKQSGLETFLSDAVESGARIVARCHVDRVTLAGGKASGVEAVATDSSGAAHRLVVRAPCVVVAGGSVESPALLLRSGLANPNIGRHLRIHPAVAVVSHYEEPVEVWKGHLQTTVCDQFAWLDGNNGFRLEVAPGHPGLIGVAVPWAGGRDHKDRMRRSAHTATFIVLTRDSSEGRVTLDSRGDPVLRYWPNELDRRHLVRGSQECARVAAAAGAVRIDTLNSPPLTVEAEGGRGGAFSDVGMQGYLREIARVGVRVNRLPLFTAHQMGTCRMGADPRTSVADPTGKVHGVEGLYVADASAMPSACGVNPMLSIMALAYRVSAGIAG